MSPIVLGLFEIGGPGQVERVVSGSVKVPAGAYSIDAHYQPAPHPDPRLAYCGPAYGFVAVLPGDERTIDLRFPEGIADPLTPILIYGTAPSALDVEVVSFQDDSACGAPVRALPIDIGALRTSIGYYGDDDRFPSLDQSWPGAALRVETPNGRRYVRLDVRTPESFITVGSTALRYDLTPKRLADIANGLPDTLICEP